MSARQAKEDNEMSGKIKNGELRVMIEEEEPIWCDKKRTTFFGLPLSFTKYTLTKSKLLVETGFFKKNEEETRLYRITDVSLEKGFFERMFGLGTVSLLSSDTSTPSIKLIHIKNAKKVKEVLSQSIECSRRENGVRTSEMVGIHHPGHFDGEPGGARGPEIIPDANHNGIDDRNE